jgi:cysteine desulfurase
MNERIYFDNNAGTLIDPRLLPILIDSVQNTSGNPSSLHSYGREARAALNKARGIIAAFFNTKPSEIIFTSSGTEAINMVLKGICAEDSRGHLITSNVEHAAVYTTMRCLESKGWQVDYLKPGLWGSIKPEMVEAAIKSNTRLITLMAVNNETGVKTDIQAIADIAKQAKIPFLVDGVALLGKETFTIPNGVSAMCFSGYKLHAIKGIACAYVRSSLKLDPLITGGDQEFGRRAGTENLPGIITLSEALQIAAQELPQATNRMAMLRDKLEQSLISRLPGVHVNGLGPRICNTSNLSFEGIEGETLLAKLDMEGIAVSHGSACSSGALEPSRVLLNMGLPRHLAASAIRFSLSRFTTESEIDAVIETVIRLVSFLRSGIGHSFH